MDQISKSLSADTARTQALGQRHLWTHVSDLGVARRVGMRIVDRGEGCYVFDQNGRRLLDGTAGHFSVQIGYGRDDVIQNAADRSKGLGYQSVWSNATHSEAVEFAARLAQGAPGDLNLVFFTTGGTDAVEAAWKLARQYFAECGKPGKYKTISRHYAYHGASIGALAITALPMMREAFNPVAPGGHHVTNTYRYRTHFPEDTAEDEEAFGKACADEFERVILREGADTVAAVFIEPVQNWCGCLVPPKGYLKRLKEICVEHDVLLVSDEIITAMGRLGTMYSCGRLEELEPDMILLAKGLTSGYSPLGAVVISDRIAEPFLQEGHPFMHGSSGGGHPYCCAVGNAALDVLENEKVFRHVREHEGTMRAMLESFADLEIVGDIRGMGYFQAIELVKNPETAEPFAPDKAKEIAKHFQQRLNAEGFLTGHVFNTDGWHKGKPCITTTLGIAPSLVAGEEEIEHMGQMIRAALEDTKPLT